MGDFYPTQAPSEPARSSSVTCSNAPGDTACEISARCKLIVALLHHAPEPAADPALARRPRRSPD